MCVGWGGCTDVRRTPCKPPISTSWNICRTGTSHLKGVQQRADTTVRSALHRTLYLSWQILLQLLWFQCRKRAKTSFERNSAEAYRSVCNMKITSLLLHFSEPEEDVLFSRFICAQRGCIDLFYTVRLLKMSQAARALHMLTQGGAKGGNKWEQVSVIKVDFIEIFIKNESNRSVQQAYQTSHKAHLKEKEQFHSV